MSATTADSRTRMLTERSLSRWDRFWFTPAPPHAISLFRILFGALVLAEVLYKLPYRHELYADDTFNYSWMSEYAVSRGWTDVIYALLIVSLVAFTFGIFTRFSNATALLLYGYFYGIAVGIADKGYDAVQVIILFLLLLSPCGARYSIDAVRRRRRQKPEKVGGQLEPFWAQRLIQLEIAIIYLFTGLTKFNEPTWPSGLTLQYTFMSRWANDFGLWLSNYLGPEIYRLGAWGTIFFELSAGFLLFSPRWRKYAIITGLSFHLLIEATLFLPFFSFLFIITYLLYPDPAIVRDRLKSAETALWRWMARIAQARAQAAD